MKKGKQYSSKDRGTHSLKCMNHDPDNSKWGMFAPSGGCCEVVVCDKNAVKVLCWRCTGASANMTVGGSRIA